MQVKKQQLELDMEQQTGSKLGKEYVKAVYCHPAYLTDMQSTSWETLDWKKHRLELRLPAEIPITSDMQMIQYKETLVEGEKGEWKSWLKAQHSENEDHGIWSHHFREIDGETVEAVADLFWGAPKSLQMVTAAMKLKDAGS